MAAGRMNAATDRSRLGAFVGRGSTDGAPCASGSRLVLLEISIAGIILDSNSKPALDVNIIGRTIAGIRPRKTTAGQASCGCTLHVLVTCARGRPAMRLFRIPLIRPQAGSSLVWRVVATHIANHFISVWHNGAFLRSSARSFLIRANEAVQPPYRSRVVRAISRSAAPCFPLAARGSHPRRLDGARCTNPPKRRRRAGF
jgi:hypothetical protein